VAERTGASLGLTWIKFNAVGAIGIGVQLAVLTLLKSVLGLEVLVATALAVETAVIHNFLWHERWTWVHRLGARNPVRESMARLLRFNLTTGAVSILGNVVLMYLLARRLGLHYFVANLATITACSILNFLVSDRFVFQPAPFSRG
jgi:putative flippase GtrA